LSSSERMSSSQQAGLGTWKLGCLLTTCLQSPARGTHLTMFGWTMSIIPCSSYCVLDHPTKASGLNQGGRCYSSQSVCYLWGYLATHWSCLSAICTLVGGCMEQARYDAASNALYLITPPHLSLQRAHAPGPLAII
jgi:hypothetical protein